MYSGQIPDSCSELEGMIDSMGEMNRTPPASVCKILREEVNYGCPVEGCGSPFLTWHHFDPMWKEQHHYNPEGMIALCGEHARMADSGIYTKEKLKHWKTNPFVKDRLSVLWPWEPENLIFLMGGSIFFSVRPLLTLRQRKVFGAERVQVPGAIGQKVVFDLDLVDPQGNPIVDMEQNWLTIHTNRLADLRFASGSKEFFVSHTSGLKMSIRFNRYLPHDFESRLSRLTNGNKLIVGGATEFAKLHSLDSEGRIPVVILAGKLFNNDVTLNIKEKVIDMDCHFFHGEKVKMTPKCSLQGSIVFNLGGQGEIIRFG